MNWNSLPRERVSIRTWFAWGLLLVLIYLALIPVFWNLTFPDNEAWALYIAGLPFSEQLARVRADLVHPPLMYLVQRGWLAAFGESDNAAHALPLAIVPPTLLLLTLLATRITAHWRLLSFFLATLFYEVGTPATLTRMYGLALLLTVSGLLLWDNWRANPRTLTLAAWAVVMTLLIYTHLFGALVVTSFVLLNWLIGPRKWAFTLAAGAPALAFLPWFLYVLPFYRARGLAANLPWVHQRLSSAIPTLFFDFLGGIYFNSHSLVIVAILVSAAIHFGLLALAWWNRASFWPPRRDADVTHRWFWSALVLAAVPILMLLAFSIVATRAFESRLVLCAAIPYSLFVFLLCQLSGRAGRIVLLCVLLPWRVASIGDFMHLKWTPDSARIDTEFVAANLRPGDLLLVDHQNHGSGIYWEWNRRLHRSEPLVLLDDESGTPPLIAVQKPVPFNRIELTGIQRIWVFLRRPDEKRLMVKPLSARGFVLSPGSTAGVPDLQLFERKTQS